MDLTHDNVDVSAIAETGGKIFNAVKSSGIVKSVRDKAKAKKAQKISDAGGYFTLSGYQKSLIDVPEYAKAQAAATGNIVSNDPNQPLINAAGQVDISQAPALPATDAQLKVTLKKFMPYILGVLVLVGIFIFIKKRK